MADIPKTRLFHPTPDRLILALLAVEGLLFLADCFRWLPKGWPVLIAIATVGAALVLFLLWFLLSLLFRWQFQFSIRSLLVLTVAVAIPCSWLAWEMKAAREQAATVRAVEDVGGCVAYDYEEDETGSSSFDDPPGLNSLRELLGIDFFAEIVEVYAHSHAETGRTPKHITTETTDATLEHLDGLLQLRWLDLNRTQITDAGLKHFALLTHLAHLDLNCTRIADSGLGQLRGLTQLQYLDLHGTDVTDAGLRHLEGLAQLQYLDLSEIGITDVGLQHLKGLIHLHELNLGVNNITDTGLRHLESLRALTSLDLDATKVTAAGVKKLQQALPNCKIER